VRRAGTGHHAAELARGEAHAGLDGAKQLTARLEKDLDVAQRRLDAAEKARDAAMKSIEQAAARGTGGKSGL
jgi:hypothetical protein